MCIVEHTTYNCPITALCLFTGLVVGDAAGARTGGGVENSSCHWLEGVSIIMSRNS